jgi:branched-chain amino acid transport system substrate-binding protein
MILIGLAAVAGCASRRGPDPVWVGHLAPLTGPDRQEGQSARQGVQLAVEAARQEGQTVGDRPVAFRHADDRGEVQRTRAEAVRLLAVNKVAALLTDPRADLSAAAAQAVRPYNAPVVVPGELPESSLAPVFVLGVGPTRRGRILASFAEKQLKVSRAAIVCDGGNEIGVALTAAFVAGWPHRPDLEVRQWACENSSGPDIVVKQVREWKPGLVLLATGPKAFASWRQRLRQAVTGVPLLYGGEDVGEEGLGREVLADPDLYLGTTYSRTALTKEGQEFARQYEKSFGVPPDLFAAMAYDGARLLISALHEAKSADGKKVQTALAKQESFASLTGPVSWEEQRPKRSVFIVRVRKGQSRIVRTVAPGEG